MFSFKPVINHPSILEPDEDDYEESKGNSSDPFIGEIQAVFDT